MRSIILISITVAATLILTLGYALSSLWSGVIVVVALGLTWLVGQQRRLGWLNDLVFALFSVVAAVGLWWGAPAGWMLTGAVAALAAWDLARFNRRLTQVEQIIGERQLRRDHLQRLLLVVGLGLGVGGVALSIQYELSMGWAILLGFLVVFGLNRIIGVARK